MSTRRSLTAFFSVLTAGVAITAIVSAEQAAPQRDTTGQPVKGTSAISGRLVTQDQSAQPVRRATVTAIPDGGAAGPVQLRTAVTDEAGRFQIKDLPEGRYNLTAQKSPFIETRYGSTRPGGAGTPITLKAGAQMTDVVLRMARGAVLSGRILDENGDPASGVSVRVMQVRNQFGERTLASVGMAMIDTTDDRGMYRLYGLAPGEYVIAATPRSLAGEIRAMTEEEVRAVMQALQEQRAAAAQQQTYGNAATPNANPNANKPPATAPSDASKVTITYAQVYYPGATTSTMATTITVGAGEERTGLDFPLRLVRTTTIEGVVAVPEGIAPQSVQLMMQPVGPDAGTNLVNIEALIGQRVTPGPDGRFKYTGVAPGQYTISARATRGSGPVPPPPPPPPPPPGAGAGGGAGVAGAQVMTFTARGGGAGGEPAVFFSDFTTGAPSDPNAVQYWATAEVSVDGSPVSGIALTLQPGMTVTGKVEFRSGVVRPGADFKSVFLNLQQVATLGPVINLGGGPQFRVDEAGNFTISGIMPGRYRVTGLVRNPPTSGPGAGDPWYVGSAMLKGQDVLDTPLVIGPNENITGAVVTFTDTIQTIEGTLSDATGRAAPDFTILVLPADKRFWTPNSRRIRSTRPATDGGFRITGLPPGEYRLSAVTDVRPDDLNDSSFLEQMLGASIPITLAPAERKKQDVRISGGL